ncbi:carcinoembryonic antigen-related cell adhesion molecule 7-like isoform X2 [Sander lucioperca]|uniref:carcinoembryonic antigen-related cell adhesion molecule 7-like isoform X2 n=1 Tax=Sander lucioperca TaxID=283035 RepID=UPI001653DD40|nr:carcinoembryonic antigen-related cell adhesion molecule 7-like isoform X2 [Sander lucioperca]
MFLSVQNRSSEMSPSLTSMILAAWLCVSLAVVSADSEIPLYKKVGDDVVLKPGTTSGTITNIMWKHGPNIAIQWDGTEFDYYLRSRLNITNGEMTITGLTRTHSGLYTPEINDVTKNATHLIVIAPVPKPTVGKSNCGAEKTSCILTCEGNTTDAEPVTYRWKSDSDVTSSSKEQLINKGNSSSIKEFRCELENPVSQMSSDPISNPFISKPSPKEEPNVSKGLIVFVALLFVVLLLVGIHRCKAGMWFFQKESMPWQKDFWRKQRSRASRDAVSNGTTAQEKGQKDEETPMT